MSILDKYWELTRLGLIGKYLDEITWIDSRRLQFFPIWYRWRLNGLWRRACLTGIERRVGRVGAAHRLVAHIRGNVFVCGEAFWSTAAIASRLPAWRRAAKSRAAVLKGVERLRRRVAEAIERA